MRQSAATALSYAGRGRWPHLSCAPKTTTPRGSRMCGGRAPWSPRRRSTKRSGGSRTQLPARRLGRARLRFLPARASYADPPSTGRGSRTQPTSRRNHPCGPARPGACVLFGHATVPLVRSEFTAGHRCAKAGANADTPELPEVSSVDLETVLTFVAAMSAQALYKAESALGSASIFDTSGRF